MTNGLRRYLTTHWTAVRAIVAAAATLAVVAGTSASAPWTAPVAGGPGGTGSRALDAGLTNATQGPRRGWRFTPHPYTFLKPVQLSLPYDPAAADGQDVFTFFYDEGARCWRPLERVSVDERNHLIVSRTNHFTDM